MSVASISPSTVIPTDLTSTAPARVPTQTLDQNDFLQLLVTKMQSQDPMNPQGDTEFISQMAQFSSLENSKSMDSTMQALNASSMIGRSVTIQGETSVDGQAPDVTGIVTSVTMKDGAPQIEVNGDDYDLSRVSEISSGALPLTSTPLTAPTVLPKSLMAAA